MFGLLLPGFMTGPSGAASRQGQAEMDHAFTLPELMASVAEPVRNVLNGYC